MNVPSSRSYTITVGKSESESAKTWLLQIFDAKAASTGGVLRRKKRDVLLYASLAALKAEVAKRGFHLVEIADQYVILCNKGQITLHV